MLVLAMEFSRGTTAYDRRRSLATEKEQLGPAHSEAEAAGSMGSEASSIRASYHDHRRRYRKPNNQ